MRLNLDECKNAATYFDLLWVLERALTCSHHLRTSPRIGSEKQLPVLVEIENG